MDRAELTRAILASERLLPRGAGSSAERQEAEGGCGVVGVAASVRIPGRALLRSLGQMRNRGNGKGGGIAAVGLEPGFFGVAPAVLRGDYLLAVAYLDPTARPEVERGYVEPVFEVDHVFEVPSGWDGDNPGLDVEPPRVTCYFARVRPDARAAFRSTSGIPGGDEAAVDDELVYQNSCRLNAAFYASTGDKRAFVLSHGRDLLVLKLVGHGDDVIRAYGLEDLRAHVWIGHHRYPTKGRVWHPGGAHPFVGLNEALVHNGDFANYASMCASLAQRGRFPLFLTDTEVAALVFDLLHRVYGYPLEYVIEVLAPTTERDFALLPDERRRIYGMLQATHMHLSPDGPWYFLIAQSAVREGLARLIGITDTSMLRPQVFALQRGGVSIGLAASEKQAIDAALVSLAGEGIGAWARADRYWSARGGSHTDGGAFVFNVVVDEATPRLWCTDKFGREIQVAKGRLVPPGQTTLQVGAVDDPAALAASGRPATELADEAARRLPGWGYDGLAAFLGALRVGAVGDETTARAFDVLARLLDQPRHLGSLKRSYIVTLVERCLQGLSDDIRTSPRDGFAWLGAGQVILPATADVAVLVDARGLPAEGSGSPSRLIVDAYGRGARRFIVVGTGGHRFIGCGLGPGSGGVRIDVFGSSGDYLGSGLDGAEIVVHGSAQDQAAQIVKDGTLVVHGDVGQTFLYAAKGGEVYVRGNAAGRPLINAVGHPRVVINGTCLDYLAESFMAGDPLAGGGFVVLNGLAFDEDGELLELDEPYPGGNLFSLASGGAIYVRDPRGLVGPDQLNGGRIVGLGAPDWERIRPYLEKNEQIFGISLERLLTADDERLSPEQVYRKVRPAENHALSPEEAWVRPE